MAPTEHPGLPSAPTSAVPHRTPPNGAVATSIVALLAIAAFGAYLRLTHTGALGIDAWWADAVSVERGSALYAVAVFLAQAGDGVGAAACTAILAALCFALRRPRDAGAIITAALFGVAASETLKALVLRTRPTGQLFDSHGASYPSGHSMGAAAIAISVVLVAIGSERLGRRLTAWIIAAAVLWMFAMAWSRTALHVHWVTDTIAGMLLGTAAAVLARRLWFGPPSTPTIRR